MRRRTSFPKLALLLATIAIGTNARADSTDDVLSEAGEKVLQEAVAAADKAEWGVCRTKAAGIWDKIKHPAVAAILGACEAELGMNRDAAEHLDFFLQRDKGRYPNQTKAVQDRFPKVRAKVMLVTVAASEADATVWVDGAFSTNAPARIFLEPGNRVIEVRKDRFATTTDPVTATPGGEKTLDVKLVPLDAPGGAGGASSSATTGTGGSVSPPESKPVWPYILTGSIGALGIGFGIGGIVASANAAGDAGSLQCTATECTAEGDSLLGEANIWRGVGVAGFSIGAAALVGTIVYAVLPTVPTKQSGALTFLPMITPDASGAVLVGTF